MVDTKILSKEKQNKFRQKINNHSKLKEDVNLSRFETLEYSDRYERLVYRAVSEENISVSKASSLLNKDIDSIREELAKI